MNDAQGFGARAAYMGEHADVIARGQRLVHALQPFLGLGARCHARDQQHRQARHQQVMP
jgi:hypothetical protein